MRRKRGRDSDLEKINQYDQKTRSEEKKQFFSQRVAVRGHWKEPQQGTLHPLESHSRRKRTSWWRTFIRLEGKVEVLFDLVLT